MPTFRVALPAELYINVTAFDETGAIAIAKDARKLLSEGTDVPFADIPELTKIGGGLLEASVAAEYSTLPVVTTPGYRRQCLEALKVLVAGPNVWGMGDTIEEARKQCKKVDGCMPKQYVVYIVTETAYMDDNGNICTPSNAHAKLIAKVGVKQKTKKKAK